jgi:hypothetical protein
MLPAALAATVEADAADLDTTSSQTADVARQLVDRYGDTQEAPQSADALQALLQRIRRTQYDWNQVASADRLHVAWVLWEGAAPPAEHEGFLRDYLAWLEAPNRRYQIVRLALAWTVAVNPALKSIATVGDWLAAHAASLPAPWPLLASQFELFSHTNGPTTLAETFLSSKETVSAFFAGIKLPERATSGGLILEMLAIAAAATAHWAAQSPRLALRLCALSFDGDVFRPDTAIARKTGRAATLRDAIAEALLLPWQNQKPPAKVKEQIIAFLLRHYGDVRIAPKHWATLCMPAVTVMRRWLNEQAIATYFRLASRSKTVDRTRLAERQQFWLSRMADIEDAWLLAGSQGTATLADSQLAFGRLGGCRPDQTALLLRVGALTILESSHAESEAIWLPDNPFAPTLYRPAAEVYWPRALANNPDYSSAYSPSGLYKWQDRLTSFLERA